MGCGGCITGCDIRKTNQPSGLLVTRVCIVVAEAQVHRSKRQEVSTHATGPLRITFPEVSTKLYTNVKYTQRKLAYHHRWQRACSLLPFSHFPFTTLPSIRHTSTSIQVAFSSEKPDTIAGQSVTIVAQSS